MKLFMTLFTFIYLSSMIFFFQFASISGQPFCHEKERSALLKFKESISINKSASDPSGYPKIESWNMEENSDCCSWDGVKCNETSGYVIELDLSSSWLYGSIDSTSTLFNLVHLQWLSLAYNDFNGSQIPSKINNLSNLSHLNLSGSYFSGQIPLEMLQLSKLESLHLSSNGILQLQQPGLESLVKKLTNLKLLNLERVNISSPLPHLLSNLSSLTFFLSLRYCNLEGKIPSSLTNLSQLNHLDLSFNNFSTQSSSLSWIGMHSKLTHLGLSGFNLTGQIPLWLMNLTHLTYLAMRKNQFTGPIPFWLLNLNQLSTLSFSYNKLTGQIPSQISNLTQLKELYLSSNQLQGPIPSSIFELKNLENIYLPSNNLSGSMELGLFLQLESLKELDLSSNHLSLLTNSTVNTTFPQFSVLKLRSCNLRGFPDFLRNQDQLGELDLSSNKISGLIPRWLFNRSGNFDTLGSMNLSHNFLIGFELFDQQPFVHHQSYLDVSFNKLQGPLPILPISNIGFFFAAKNKLSGEITPFLCKLNSLRGLDLSHNSFNGKIPHCLSNFSQDLLLLNLQNNSFYGRIPEIFMKATQLRLIDLSNNLLHGKIPRSLANCTTLEFLDLGSNKISDTFPFWIGTLPNLEILNLKSNKLYGVIEEPKSNFEFPELQIIDLSHNRFIGKFPSKYFECWNSMKVVNESKLRYMMEGSYDGQFYYYTLTMVSKGIEIEYVKISDTVVVISLSNNRFEGDIPASISILKGLRYLDLSNNNFTGAILSSMSNLTVLESLDLSHNNLSGEIPQQLVDVTYLEYFDVSYNHLTGPIPLGAQFNTFNSRSYEGNPGLCGGPVLKKCGSSELPPNEDDRDESKSSLAFGWREVAIGYASGTIIGIALGHIFCTRKYEWFVKIFGTPSRSIKKKRGQRTN